MLTGQSVHTEYPLQTLEASHWSGACFSKVPKLFSAFRVTEFSLHLQNEGTKLCSYFYFYSLYNIWEDQLYRISWPEFDEWLFGPEKLSGLSRNKPQGLVSRKSNRPGPCWEAYARTKARTTRQNNDLIGWMRKNNRAAHLRATLCVHARFWDADGNRKWAVFSFNLFSHNHIYIAKYRFCIRDD